MNAPSKILVVEDDVELAKMVVDFLTPYGFEVLTESDGIFAIITGSH